MSKNENQLSLKNSKNLIGFQKLKMMDNVSECIRKVKHNLSNLNKDLNLLDTPPTTEPDSPASDVQNSDFIDLLNEQTNTSTTTASTKEEDCASTSSSLVTKNSLNSIASTSSSNSSIICKWVNCDWPGK